MDIEEYRKHLKSTMPKVYAESTQNKWRKQIKKAIQHAISNAPQEEVKASIDGAFPFEKSNCTLTLIWLQERRKALSELGLYEYSNPV
ncbi:hypothetical protein [Allocoleopsis sp.]|uniref:hypothetical protein n=1 Tax=Allocoleopsis sp. TaxID=3088169 RepID=UPI002FD50282